MKQETIKIDMCRHCSHMKFEVNGFPYCDQLGKVVDPYRIDEDCVLEDLDKEKIDKLVNALLFYADPDTYFAIGFLPDPPCGDFMDDFEEIDGIVRPGKRARMVLKSILPT